MLSFKIDRACPSLLFFGNKFLRAGLIFPDLAMRFLQGNFPLSRIFQFWKGVFVDYGLKSICWPEWNPFKIAGREEATQATQRGI